MFSQLYKLLFPRSGRAFNLTPDSDTDKLISALSTTDELLQADSLAILDVILPDNNDFTSDDATDWERRLGIVQNPLSSLADRKLAIKRKMNHPGEIKARQSYLFLERELQAAGFNLYVYENRFLSGYDYITKTPTEFSLDPFPNYTVQLNDQQLGDFQLGNIWSNKVANSIYQEDDDPFDVGDNLRSTFFVGGGYNGDWANVPATRETELRQLILTIKPVQTVGFLLINYI